MRHNIVTFNFYKTTQIHPIRMFIDVTYTQAHKHQVFHLAKRAQNLRYRQFKHMVKFFI